MKVFPDEYKLVMSKFQNFCGKTRMAEIHIRENSVEAASLLLFEQKCGVKLPQQCLANG